LLPGRAPWYLVWVPALCIAAGPLGDPLAPDRQRACDPVALPSAEPALESDSFPGLLLEPGSDLEETPPASIVACSAAGRLCADASSDASLGARDARACGFDPLARMIRAPPRARPRFSQDFLAADALPAHSQPLDASMAIPIASRRAPSGANAPSSSSLLPIPVAAVTPACAIANGCEPLNDLSTRSTGFAGFGPGAQRRLR
jgi:hypothetical protein